jgi:hypothetical protein
LLEVERTVAEREDPFFFLFFCLRRIGWDKSGIVVYRVAVLFKESFLRKILGDQVVPKHYLKGASAPHLQATDNRGKTPCFVHGEREEKGREERFW